MTLADVSSMLVKGLLFLRSWPLSATLHRLHMFFSMEEGEIHTYIHTLVRIYIYIYICMVERLLRSIQRMLFCIKHMNSFKHVSSNSYTYIYTYVTCTYVSTYMYTYIYIYA